MNEHGELTQDMVRRFMQFRGGKVSNQELVKQFKKQLNDPETKEAARILFKDIVNEIAFVQKEGDKKFLVLKAEYDSPPHPHPDDRSGALPDCPVQKQTLAGDLATPVRDDVEVRRSQIDFRSTELTHSQSSPSILETSAGEEERYVSSPSGWSPDLPEGESPQPPPRRKALGKESRGAKIEEKLRQLNEERENSPPKTLREEEILELSMKSPGLVKERAQKINKMASEVDLPQKSSSTANNQHHHQGHRKRDSRAGNDDDDSSSVSTLDPRSKEWVLKAAKNDYHTLVRLLKEEPKLAGFKDVVTTALHWASKHGNADTVKLIAGTHRVNTNVRSGYTPLHIAALFKHEDIMELLINTYGADSSVRDYSGKRAQQYLPGQGVLLPHIPSNGQSRHLRQQNGKSNAWSADLGFIRIGSLNSKVKKTAAALTSGGKTRIKSWGSADSISDQLASQLMPPPKFPVKKKKTKKGSLELATTPELPFYPSKSGPDSDSDGASNGIHS